MNLGAQTIETPDQMPSEVSDLLHEMKEAQAAKIEAVGKFVSKCRDEAVKGRKQSGIEDMWTEDGEFYEGVDDMNRDQVKWLKSPGTSGGLSRNNATSQTRCVSFFNITRQFCESASARMGDILLPAGDWNFSATATPVPDEDQTGQTIAPPALPAPAAPPSPTAQQAVGGAPLAGAASPPPAAPPPQPIGVAPAPGASTQKANEAKAEKAELKLQDWLVECSYHTEVRKVIEDASILGTGVLKGPFPQKMTSKVASQGPNGTTLEVRVGVNPASKRVDPWDFYPDPSCGDDIQKGSYVFEHDRLSAKGLRDLKGTPGYLPEQIDKVLEEGPGHKNYQDGQRHTDPEQLANESDLFDIWYFYGLVDVASLSALKVNVTEKDSKKDMVPAIVTMVNETPIKAAISPLDSGEYPYDVMPWQRQNGSWAGIGVARQMRVAQQMLNGAARNMMDNAGLSGGPMIIIRQNAVYPADSKWELTARKIWIASEQADIKSVQDAFVSINIPMMQVELTNIINLAKTMAEDATGITFLLQGQQGSAPDTVGGMELLHRNASAILRRLARVFDERVTEPHIKRYYEWLLMYGPDDCKGDVKIQAIGSTALVEREIQSMQTMQILNLSANPIYGLDPKKAMIEVLKTQRFIPEKFTTDANTPQAAPPVIPAIEVQKLRSADLDKQLALEKDKIIAANQLAVHKVDVDTDRDRVYAETMAQDAAAIREQRMAELQQKKELALVEYANKHNITLEQIKANLATTAMKLRTQTQLAQMAKGGPQVLTPPTEPPGKADTGHAFEE